MQVKVQSFGGVINAANNRNVLKSGSSSVKTGSGNAFGTQCKVTISQEGKKLSEKSHKTVLRSAEDAKLDKMMLRDRKQSDDYKTEYAKTLNEINELKNSINSLTAKEDKETIERKQQALRELSDLKKRQEEENDKRVKEAMNSLTNLSKQQEEIDKNNSDLLIMLKSFEESEKNEEEQTSSDDDERDVENQDATAGNGLQSAAKLDASAARNEMKSIDVIEGLENEGFEMLSRVNEMLNSIYAELDQAAEAINDGSITEEQKKQFVSERTGRAEEMKNANLLDMFVLRQKGLQRLQDARELRSRHIESNPLDGVGKAKKAIMAAETDAVRNEAAQGVLDDASQELAEQVQEELDQRNDIIPSEEEKEEEEKAEEKIIEEREREMDEEEPEREALKG